MFFWGGELMSWWAGELVYSGSWSSDAFVIFHCHLSLMFASQSISFSIFLLIFVGHLSYGSIRER